MFISRKKLEDLIDHRVRCALLGHEEVEVVTRYAGRYVLPPVAYIRRSTPHISDYQNAVADHIVSKTTVLEFLSRVLLSLGELGVEVYHNPEKKAEWGLRLKKDKI